MKIRNGFVSNSSSSSFCIYGSRISNKNFAVLSSKLGYDITEEDVTIAEESDDDILESMIADVNESLSNQKFISEVVRDGSNRDIYIDRYFKDMRDDETYGQFKRSVDDVLNKFLPNLKAYYYEEGWYD